MSRLLRPATLAAVAAALSALVISTPSTAASGRVALPDPNPSGLSGTIVPLPAAQQLSLRVYLSDQPGLAAAATAVADPNNPGYAHYLTPAQARARYGTTAAETGAVRDWLTGRGITVTATTPHYLAVTATVAQADAAFATQVVEYDTTIDEGKGGTFTERQPGTTGGFSIPAALGADITSVTGIDQIDLPDSDTAAVRAQTPRRQQAAAKPAATTDGVPCSQYWQQYTTTIPAAYGHSAAPTQLCGYTPAQIRSAYGVSSSPYTGKGATVAVILNGTVPTEAADADEFFANHGEAGFAPGQFSEVDLPGEASTCNEDTGTGDPLEESLDVQTVHMAAPDAHVVYVGADCSNNADTLTQDWLDAVTAIVDAHLADVATGSFGWVESDLARADVAAWDETLEQGALEGIGFNFSSGDGGDLGNTGTPNPRQAQFPATDQWVTAVGGTSAMIGANGSIVADYPWGDNLTAVDAAGTGYSPALPGSFIAGSGGGLSTFYPEPGYQKATVPTSLATDNGTGAPARVIPDISANAGSNYLIGFTGAITDGQYGEIIEGGTSGSSPLMAGLEADAKQAAGHALGFANPVLYALRGSTGIRDVLAVNPNDPPIAFGTSIYADGSDNLTVLGEDSQLAARPGYDDVTGIGAPTPAFVSQFRRY